jgi:hypothetical protein
VKSFKERCDLVRGDSEEWPLSGLMSHTKIWDMDVGCILGDVGDGLEKVGCWLCFLYMVALACVHDIGKTGRCVAGCLLSLIAGVVCTMTLGIGKELAQILKNRVSVFSLSTISIPTF